MPGWTLLPVVANDKWQLVARINELTAAINERRAIVGLSAIAGMVVDEHIQNRNEWCFAAQNAIVQAAVWNNGPYQFLDYTNPDMSTEATGTYKGFTLFTGASLYAAAGLPGGFRRQYDRRVFNLSDPGTLGQRALYTVTGQVVEHNGTAWVAITPGPGVFPDVVESVGLATANDHINGHLFNDLYSVINVLIWIRKRVELQSAFAWVDGYEGTGSEPTLVDAYAEATANWASVPQGSFPNGAWPPRAAANHDINGTPFARLRRAVWRMTNAYELGDYMVWMVLDRASDPGIPTPYEFHDHGNLDFNGDLFHVVDAGDAYVPLFEGAVTGATVFPGVGDPANSPTPTPKPGGGEFGGIDGWGWKFVGLDILIKPAWAYA